MLLTNALGHARLFLCVRVRAGGCPLRNAHGRTTWCVSCLCLSLCPSSSQLPCRVVNHHRCVSCWAVSLCVSGCRGSVRHRDAGRAVPTSPWLVPVTSLFGASIPASGHRSPPLNVAHALALPALTCCIAVCLYGRYACGAFRALLDGGKAPSGLWLMCGKCGSRCLVEPRANVYDHSCLVY